MKSAVDTSVIVHLVGSEPSVARVAHEILREARRTGAIVICGVVYSELLAHPRMTPSILEQLLAETDVSADFETGHEIWNEAGLRYCRYSARRRKSGAGAPRRLLADFVIGAHALLRADCLVTFDTAGYRHDFPELRITPRKAQ